MKKRLRWTNLVIALSVIVMLGAVIWIVRNLADYKKAESLYTVMAQDMTTDPPEESQADTRNVPSFEEWLKLTGAGQETAGEVKEPESAATAPAEQSADDAGQTNPMPPEGDGEYDPAEVDAAQQRAADEGEAAQKYAELMSGSAASAVDGLTDEAKLRSSYRAWLIENGFLSGETGTSAMPLMDFTELTQINSDVVGWLRCDDTVIDYPVVQRDDNDFYLHHLFDGSTNAAGTLFVDQYNSPEFEDQNTIIYGHHMKNDTMFGTLVNYQKQEYFDEHPVMYLYTPTATYMVELFAGYTIQVDYTENPGFTMVFENGESFLKWVDDARRKSTFQSDVTISEEDRLITLCTCTYEVYNARYLLLGKLTLLSEPTEE